MAKEIINNNIRGISKEGKEYWFTWEWFKTFSWMLNNDIKEVESEIKGVFDKSVKGKVKVKKIFLAPMDNNLLEKLRNKLIQGQEVEIKGWKFKIV